MDMGWLPRSAVPLSVVTPYAQVTVFLGGWEGKAVKREEGGGGRRREERRWEGRGKNERGE